MAGPEERRKLTVRLEPQIDDALTAFANANQVTVGALIQAVIVLVAVDTSAALGTPDVGEWPDDRRLDAVRQVVETARATDTRRRKRAQPS